MKYEEFENLIEEEGKAIYSYCLYLTQSRDRADDLYQEAMLSALEKLAKIDFSSNPKSYILSIATNQWRATWRKERRRQRILPINSLEQIQDETGLEAKIRPSQTPIGPEDLYFKQEESERILAAVQSVDDRYRIPILLYYTAELTYQEISETICVPLGTVKRRLHEAKKQLKCYLQEDNVQEDTERSQQYAR